MTEPTAPRPMPGPPRTGPAPTGAPVAAPAGMPGAEGEQVGSPTSRDGEWSAGLDALPVAEHVAVFEGLQRELGTIDPS
jgi:hypothetical protein